MATTTARSEDEAAVPTAQQWFAQGQRIRLQVPVGPDETLPVHIAVHILPRQVPPGDPKSGSSSSNDGDDDDDGTEWVTFLHGFPTCSHDFVCLLPHLGPALRSRYNMLLWDLWGYGNSDKDAPLPPSFSVNAQADVQQLVWKHLGVRRTHVVSHDLGDTVLQELLARASEQQQAATHPHTHLGDLFIFNGGIFPGLHRPVLLQRLLLHPWLGPLLSRYAMGYWTFAKGVQGVFAPGHPPSERVLADMWESVRHREGTRNYHVLIRYILDRHRHRERWEAALDWAAFADEAGESESGMGAELGSHQQRRRRRRRRVRYYWGMMDPVSGAHLAAELWRRYGALFREEGGRGRVSIVERGELGHWPMLEDPRGAAAAVAFFFVPLPKEDGRGVEGGGPRRAAL